MPSSAVSTSSSNSFMLRRMGELKRVTVVGAGTMGSQIALQTALSGRYEVTLVDTVAGQLERARAQNSKLVDRSVEKGRLTPERAAQALERIADSATIAPAVANADLVIEAVIEKFDAKTSGFEELGKQPKKDAVLPSTSSTIAISRVAEFTARREPCSNHQLHQH